MEAISSLIQLTLVVRPPGPTEGGSAAGSPIQLTLMEVPEECSRRQSAYSMPRRFKSCGRAVTLGWPPRALALPGGAVCDAAWTAAPPWSASPGLGYCGVCEGDGAIEHYLEGCAAR